MAKNVHKVQVRQWRRWNRTGQAAFNNLYSTMVRDQDLFLHPKTPRVSREQWKTTCWNAAWTAADIAHEVGVTFAFVHRLYPPQKVKS